VLGKARTLIDWARAFFARDPSLQVGKTRAWEARLELEKLPKQITDYMRSIGVDPTKTPEHVDAYIRGLLDQLAEHATALKDAERGSGRIAAHDRSEPPKRTARQAALEDGREYATHITDIPSASVTVKGAPSTQQHISVWRDGGKLEVRVPERGPDGTLVTAVYIADAVSDHQQLADRRPVDPLKPDAARPWTALDEARYRGYPDPDATHAWAWKDGALVLDGVPPQHYNKTTGAFDGGGGSAKHPAAPPDARLKPQEAARSRPTIAILDNAHAARDRVRYWRS
jgi:hypothetical protein